MEYRLLIEPIIKSHARILGIFKTTRIIQNRQFDHGVKIKNIDEKSFPGGKITDIKMRSVVTSYNIIVNVRKEFSIRSLNPGEVVDIWFDKYVPSIDGSFWFEISLHPNKEDDKIISFVWDELNEVHSNPKTNTWQDIIFITNEGSINQTTTNYLLVVLTLILLIDQIFGTKEVITGVINSLIFILNLILTLLSSIV